MNPPPYSVGHVQNEHLEEAEMALKGFTFDGDLNELKGACRKARTALVTGKTLDVEIYAAVIAISAGYVYRSMVSLLE